MRVLCLVTWLALASACSSFSVRCDSRLRPINPRQAPASRSQAPQSPPAPRTAGSASDEPVKP